MTDKTSVLTGSSFDSSFVYIVERRKCSTCNARQSLDRFQGERKSCMECLNKKKRFTSFAPYTHGTYPLHNRCLYPCAYDLMAFRRRCEAQEAAKAKKMRMNMALMMQQTGFNDQDSNPAYGMGSSTAVPSDDPVSETEGGVTQRERSWIMSWIMNNLTHPLIMLAIIPACAVIQTVMYAPDAHEWATTRRKNVYTAVLATEVIVATAVVGIVIACNSRRKAIEEAWKIDISASRKLDPEIQRLDTTPQSKEEEFNLDVVKSLYWTHLAILSCGLALWGYSSYTDRCLGKIAGDCIAVGYFIVFCHYVRAGLSMSPLTLARIDGTRLFSEGVWLVTMAMPGVVGRIRTRLYGGMKIAEMIWGENACVGLSNNTDPAHTLIPISVLIGCMLLATRMTKYSSAGVGMVITGMAYVAICCIGQHLMGGGLESNLYCVLFAIIGLGLGDMINSRIEASCAKKHISDQSSDQSSDLPTVACFEMSAMTAIMFENDCVPEKSIIKKDSPYMSASSQESSEDDGSDDGSQVSSEDFKCNKVNELLEIKPDHD